MSDSPDDPRAGDLDIAMVAAALRADVRDLEAYATVLTGTLGDALPPGAVEVDRSRSVGDRLAGRPGTVTRIRAHLDEVTLELEPVRGRAPRARIVTEVGGVVISRRETTVEEWSQTLAAGLAAQARRSEEARRALARLLGL
ncbi:hypothetical protein P5P86_12115 [Nocardioides sp. BP30]|uniref:hypothetical protein n=1 Tax=Nocardioides sp. BP30 TaxID=3036374 RepID=UPI0024698408|nr:hypothetical protein [Nocardioides sp. BP30]WGL50708.1 hypothetical protein P5P86_12115 [Nocardioides sp. BP30]